ncbi:MAG: hypothetical protein JWQ19_3947 [Subtercola sp.]|nr:hypothetical protein [Subtercola sp.]
MTALPYATLQRATAGLRVQLRLQMAAGELPDWDTLEVTGPVESVDARGRTWFHYRATAAPR